MNERSRNHALGFAETLEGHQRKPTKFNSYAEQVKGAALFAKAIAVKHADAALIAAADQILLWLDQRDDAFWEGSNVDHDRIGQRDQAKSNVRKTTARTVKEFVGMEVEDPRWDALVDEYRTVFPTFLIRNSATDRLHPRKHSASIGSHLIEFVQAQRHGIEPLLSEIQELHPQALVAHREEILKYLERALPGFDFATALPRADQATHIHAD